MYAQVSDKPRVTAKDTLKYITGFFFDGFVICSDHRLLYGILHTHKLCSCINHQQNRRDASYVINSKLHTYHDHEYLLHICNKKAFLVSVPNQVKFELHFP